MAFLATVLGAAILEPNANASFVQTDPLGDLFPGCHVGIPIALEDSFQFLQLLAGEMSALSARFLSRASHCAGRVGGAA